MTTWSLCRHFPSQAQICTVFIEDYAFAFVEAASLLHRIACYLQDYALYEQAELMFQRAMRIQRQALGPEHPDVATSLNGLANLYWKQGKYEQTESLYHSKLCTSRNKLWGLSILMCVACSPDWVSGK
jgi:tetratricopeptide (TPR) repeat protein